ncbi:phosphoglycerate mutase [Gemmatimonadetes bacterium T265]|nr:phosphoglycerate mutase [Gemmatimonadetes bacterium T265]
MRVLLVRHALCDPVGVRLAGRVPGVSLNAAGRAQLAPLAARVGRRLAGARLDAVLASPLARAQETAGALARAHDVAVTTEPALNEMDLGRWTGRALDTLDHDPEWKPFNTYRSGTPAGGGELQLQVQARAAASLLARARATPDATVAAVTHGDVLKAVLGHLLGVPLDLQHRIEISPASVSEVDLQSWGPRILSINDVS